MQTKLPNTLKKMTHRERGVAMFMAIFALLLLTAISAGFVFMEKVVGASRSAWSSLGRLLRP